MLALRSDNNSLEDLDHDQGNSCRPDRAGRYFSCQILRASGSWQPTVVGMSDKSDRARLSARNILEVCREGGEGRGYGEGGCSLCPLATSQPSSFSLARRPVKSVTPRPVAYSGTDAVGRRGIPRNHRPRRTCICTRRRAPVFAYIRTHTYARTHIHMYNTPTATFIYRVCALTSAPFDAVIHRPQTLSIGPVRRPNRRLDSERGCQYRLIMLPVASR